MDATSTPSSGETPSPPVVASTGSRSPDEVRAYESRVWDLTQNLVHPAFLYAICQVAIWCSLERNPKFQPPELGFWVRSGVHALQFLGAWAVLYGTLLRDMGRAIRTPTLALWFAVLGVVTVWVWPDAPDIRFGNALRVVLGVQLLVDLVAWLHTMRTFARARREDLAAGVVA